MFVNRTFRKSTITKVFVVVEEDAVTLCLNWHIMK